jgi:peptidylprolyl isomerase
MVAKSGDIVVVHYTGRLTDGSVFDSSEGREPLQFEAGSGMVIPGFDNGIIGMTVGEKKTVHIPCAEAYGPANPDMIFTVNRLEIPDNIPLQVGGTLNMHNGQQTIPVVITKLTALQVELDANMPLAGKDLIFDIELVEVEDGSSPIEVEYSDIQPQSLI